MPESSFSSLASITRALSISGNAMAAISGVTIYAPVAQLAESGNGQLNDSLIIGTLNLSGNAVLTQTAAGSDNSGDLSTAADTLLAGDQYVYLNDPNSLFTSDELARIRDAINGLDNLLAPYSVRITEVTDPMMANLVIDIGSTSAAGTAAQGVLACEEPPRRLRGQISILHVNAGPEYAGSDPGAIGSGQYDFQTVVTHEFGHALGLGHNTNPSSVMHATLASGTTRRTMTAVDLNIPDAPDAGPDPLMAAGFHPVTTPISVPLNAFSAVFGSASTPVAVGVLALPSAGIASTQSRSGGAVVDAPGFTQVATSRAFGQPPVVGVHAKEQAGSEAPLVVQVAGCGESGAGSGERSAVNGQVNARAGSRRRPCRRTSGTATPGARFRRVGRHGLGPGRARRGRNRRRGLAVRRRSIGRIGWCRYRSATTLAQGIRWAHVLETAVEYSDGGCVSWRGCTPRVRQGIQGQGPLYQAERPLIPPEAAIVPFAPGLRTLLTGQVGIVVFGTTRTGITGVGDTRRMAQVDRRILCVARWFGLLRDTRIRPMAPWWRGTAGTRGFGNVAGRV